MNISIIIPSWNKEKALATARNLEQFDTFGVVNQVIISGAERTEKRWGCVEAMAKGAEKATGEILVFCHDDIEVYEDWSASLYALFSLNNAYYPKPGLAGFHGAKGLGSADIYKTRYELRQLARFDPLSNMVDAEAHGRRTTIPQEIATVDGFFMAVSLDAYEAVGGWEACLRDRIPYHMYDSWMAMAVREQGYKVYLVPTRCRHYGGGTEVRMSEAYETWARENGFKDAADVHTQGHLAFYERFRGQLPVRIN